MITVFDAINSEVLLVFGLVLQKNVFENCATHPTGIK